MNFFLGGCLIRTRLLALSMCSRGQHKGLVTDLDESPLVPHQKWRDMATRTDVSVQVRCRSSHLPALRKGTGLECSTVQFSTVALEFMVCCRCVELDFIGMYSNLSNEDVCRSPADIVVWSMESTFNLSLSQQALDVLQICATFR